MDRDSWGGQTLGNVAKFSQFFHIFFLLKEVFDKLVHSFRGNFSNVPYSCRTVPSAFFTQISSFDLSFKFWLFKVPVTI